MYAYKTNSADYLDYVASVKSRLQILADPNLCPLLENPYIKDNMEVAIRWNKAKYGDYQDKYDFLEYFFCNGPLLDADTILHYREKAYNDPVCMEIAYSYLTDVQLLAKIRELKYNKTSEDCFNKPCFYLGKFSAMMGAVGDSSNTKSTINSSAGKVAGLWSATKRKILNYKRKKNGLEPLPEIPIVPEKPQLGTPIPGSQQRVEPVINDANNPQSAQPTAGMRKAFEQAVIPSLKKGWNMMIAQIATNNDDFTELLMLNYNTAANAKHIGDWMSQPISDMLDLITKANVRRQLGDCGRLWSQVRRLHLFGSDNKYGPVRTDQLVGLTNPNGTPRENTIPVTAPSSGEALGQSSTTPINNVYAAVLQTGLAEGVKVNEGIIAHSWSQGLAYFIANEYRSNKLGLEGNLYVREGDRYVNHGNRILTQSDTGWTTTSKNN